MRFVKFLAFFVIMQSNERNHVLASSKGSGESRGVVHLPGVVVLDPTVEAGNVVRDSRTGSQTRSVDDLIPSPPLVQVADEHRKISHQTFVGLSIANEEKIFFDNMNSAAQQLSLLGIKAVGLATQIQAIRGHIMMLQLIDGHIATLTTDHARYTDLLTQAHAELKKATGVSDPH